MTKKILIIWDRMGDYHRARVKEVAKLLGSENVFSADLGSGDGIYQWDNTDANAHHFVLSSTPVDQVDIKSTILHWKQIITQNNITHICIPGYGRKIYRKMLIESKKMGLQTLMFAESWYPGKLPFDIIKGIWLKPKVDVFFVSGIRAAQHFRDRLKLDKKKIIEGYSVVDNNHFSTGKTTKENKPTLLCVARFAPEKNLQMLIEAFMESTLSQQWQLKIVGGGPLKESLHQSISNNQNIVLHDWLSYNELPDLYASASAFILPSQFEPWGLVVNEAMAAGLPILLSEEVGALPDLLEVGVNGLKFNIDKQELINSLNQLSDISTEDRSKMGQRSLEIIKNYSCETWAEKMRVWILGSRN